MRRHKFKDNLLNIYRDKLIEFAFISDPNSGLKEVKDSLSTQRSRTSSKGAITRKFNQQFKSLAPSVRKKMASLSPEEADIYRMKLFSILNSTTNEQKVKEAISRLNKPSRRKPPVYQKTLPEYVSKPRDRGLTAILDTPIVDAVKTLEQADLEKATTRREIIKQIGDKTKGIGLIYYGAKRNFKEALLRTTGLDSVIQAATSSKDTLIKALKEQDFDKFRLTLSNTLSMSKAELDKVVAQAKLYSAVLQKAAKTKTTRRTLLGLPEAKPDALDVKSQVVTSDIWDEPLPPSSRLPQPKVQPKPTPALPPGRSLKPDELFGKRKPPITTSKGQLVKPEVSQTIKNTQDLVGKKPFFRKKGVIGLGIAAVTGLTGYAGYKRLNRRK